MAVNKVIYGGNELINLTGDTVSEESLLEGATAHDKSGRSITGTLTLPTYALTKNGNRIVLTKNGVEDSAVEDNDTTYSNFVKSGSGAKAGLVPAPSTTEGNTKYLREDGTWAEPPSVPSIKAANGSNINSVGTPSVTAITSGNETTFTFNYLKGTKGDKGDTGEQGPQGPPGEAGVFPYSYGTEDLVAGSSTLATGQLYFVYE